MSVQVCLSVRVCVIYIWAEPLDDVFSICNATENNAHSNNSNSNHNDNDDDDDDDQASDAWVGCWAIRQWADTAWEREREAEDSMELGRGEGAQSVVIVVHAGNLNMWV